MTAGTSAKPNGSQPNLVVLRGHVVTLLLSGPMPNLFVSTVQNPDQEFELLLHLGHGGSLLEKSTRRTDLDTLATRGAAFGLAPQLVHAGNDIALDSAPHHIEAMSAFHFITGTHAPCTKNTPVGIPDIPLMAGIHGQLGGQVVIAYMIHPQFCSHGLQLAMAIHDTSGTDVVALSQEQLNHHLPILLQPFSLGLYNHSFLNLRDAGSGQPGIAFYFDQAKAAATPLGETFQAAKGGDIDPGIFSRTQHRLAWLSTDQFIINGKGDNL
jgi:hypothetical protein